MKYELIVIEIILFGLSIIEFFFTFTKNNDILFI